MLEFIRKLFASDFMPHGMCYLWDPAVLWVNVISDILIAVSYYAIPLLLFQFVRRRRDVQFRGIFVAFGIFILACGTTHVMGAVTVWNPVYRLDGLVKVITALASVITFAMLLPMMPGLIALPSPAELESVNRKLASEIEERRAAEDRVRRINEDLEERVARRTAERMALEDQLIQSQKMEAVGRLAGGVAHDFNNLLTAILGYNEMLRERVIQDEEALEYADEIHQAAARASALTNQLLAFSRRQVAVMRVIDLNEVVGGIDRMLSRLIGEDIEIETRLGADLPRVQADPSHLDQIIMNLAINSRDAMPEGGKLTIETSQAQGAVLLAVRDTGIGMNETTRARVFEPFFTTKEKGKGTGLGLSIVYGIVKQNHGEIAVDSELGVGTVFRIYLPAVDAPAEPLKAPEPASPAKAHETVLLVEDEEQVRSLARTMLSRQGYRVLEAAGGSDALRLAAEFAERIDLLVTDVVMPGMGGAELAKELVALRPGLRVLYMSGYTQNAIINQGKAPGTGFLQKPFTAASLYKKVREMLTGAVHR